MHFVLRSTRAKGVWSFTRHRKTIETITRKFAKKYGVKVYGIGNAGNHLHYHIKLSNRFTYKPFIRALTSAIAMAVSKSSRWNKIGKFWDQRPFSRIVFSYTAFKRLQDYLIINDGEGRGHTRQTMRRALKEPRLDISPPWPI